CYSDRSGSTYIF
nr:immunoglobulin light chain junction region [Macaca mulatta]